MTPEELLRQASATSRAAHQQKQARQQKIRSRQNPHAVALPYDGDRGSQQIQLSDGSIREAETNSNGAIGTGDTVALHQGKGRSRINVMPHKPTRQQAVAPQSSPPGLVKVLFSVVADGVRSFFVGGDRQTPVKIFELPSSVFVEAYITNTGKSLNSWIASFRYEGAIKIVTSQGQWEHTSLQSQFTQYKGGGFWVSNIISADASAGAYIQQTTGSGGELQCGGTTYYLINQIITGREIGPITPSFLSGSISVNGAITAGDDGGSPAVGIVTSEQISELRAFEAVTFGLIKSEFNSIPGSRTYSIEYSSSRGCDSGISSTEQEQILSGGTYLAPEIQKEYTKTQRSVFRTDNPDINEESLSYYSAIFSGTNSGSAIALKTSQTHLGQNSDAGLKLLTKTENGVTETAIDSALPAINLATQNLIGSKLYQVPISGEYKTKKADIELDIFTFANTINQSKKTVPVFSLKSQSCTIHSASAFL